MILAPDILPEGRWWELTFSPSTCLSSPCLLSGPALYQPGWLGPEDSGVSLQDTTWLERSQNWPGSRVRNRWGKHPEKIKTIINWLEIQETLQCDGMREVGVDGSPPDQRCQTMPGWWVSHLPSRDPSTSHCLTPQGNDNNSLVECHQECQK